MISLADTLADLVRRGVLTKTQRAWLLSLAEHEKQVAISELLDSHVNPEGATK